MHHEKPLKITSSRRKSCLSYQQPKNINLIVEKIMTSLTQLKEIPKEITKEKKTKNYLTFIKKMKKDKTTKPIIKDTNTPFEVKSITPIKKFKHNTLFKQNFKRRKSKSDKEIRNSKADKEQQLNNGFNINKGDFLTNFQNIFKSKLEEEKDNFNES
jgi:hypothetical protein